MVLMALKTVKTLTEDYEVLVINDGSTDYTLELLRHLETQQSNVKIIDHGENRGYGTALRTGFAKCSKDLVFYTDGDAQYDVRELPLLFARLSDGVDWVNGFKISRSDPLHRRIIGRIYHWIARLSFGLKLRDVDCDFRLIRKSALERVKLKSESGVICVEMIRKFQDAGFRVAEVPVHHYFRAYGKSQFFNFKRVAHVCVNLVQLWWELVLLPKIHSK
jgi:glycosyltransferase involved in cell wall biosynthesis